MNTRRHFLRAAGACIALPLLESLGWRRFASAAESISPPTRVVFLGFGWGVTNETWFPDVKRTGANWELSAGRANAARAVLSSQGIGADRIFEVSGKAGTDPLLPDDPYASSNRRISILLMREAPVVPPGLKL